MEPDIRPVREHYEVYLNGKFICSADTSKEAEEEYKEVPAGSVQGLAFQALQG